MNTKKIVSVQDISCYGQCSLTVAQPVLSAYGFETAILPSAILSTHTGGFTGFTVLDLTDEMPKIVDHWRKEKITFDAIYTGYLGTEEEIETVKQLIADFRTPDTLVVIDPAMADNGNLYVGFDKNFALEMGSLCREADIALPNISEAAFMLGIDYPGEEASEEVTRDILKRLADTGIKFPVITGVTLKDGSFGFMGYDSAKDEFISYGAEKVPTSHTEQAMSMPAHSREAL